MLSGIIKKTHGDDRGHVSTFPFASAQCNISFNYHAGTLRGMHYREPAEEKIVLCTSGSIYDVAVDLVTGDWHSMVMLPGRARYIPAGFAHGFQTLEDNTEVLYLVSELYDPKLAKVVRYDSLGIDWPLPVAVISQKDKDALPYLPLG